MNLFVLFRVGERGLKIVAFEYDTSMTFIALKVDKSSFADIVL